MPTGGWQWESVKTFDDKVAEALAMREAWIGPWREVVEPITPKLQGMATTLRRAPARKCNKDAKRWKRRRFIQGLAS